MIFLVRPDNLELAAKQAELTGIYIAQKACIPTKNIKDKLYTTETNFSEDVWLRDYISNPLFEMSNKRCAFCENVVPLTKKGKPELQVDHFLPKEKYPDLVVWWENLLPTCWWCNKRKLTYDSALNVPLVNPCEDDIKAHFKMEFGRLYPLTDSGYTTEDKLHLNQLPDTENGFCAQRRSIYTTVEKKLNETLGIAKALYPLPKRKSAEWKKSCEDIVNRLTNLLEAMLPNAPKAKFIAAHATALLHTNSDYWEIKRICQDPKIGIWTLALNDLENTIQQYSLA